MAYSFSDRLYRYRVTLEKYKALLTRQDNCCAICKQAFTETPCIDHDHSCCPVLPACGKCVRGLLCSQCNKGIAFFDDDPDRLHNASEYLKATNVKG